MTETTPSTPAPRVVATHIWPPDSELPKAVPAIDLDWGGPIGDRHHGELMSADVRQAGVFERGTTIRNHRQISIVDVQELAGIAAALGLVDIAPGTIADNIATQGIPDLTALPRMSRLLIGAEVVVMTGGENLPCTSAGRLVQERYGTAPEAFPRAALGRRGVTAWVERPGTIRPGDAIRIVLP